MTTTMRGIDMSKTIDGATLDDVRTLTAEADEAARRAAEIVGPAHGKALNAARALVQEKSAATDDRSARVEFATFIEEAVDARQPDPDTAKAVFAQYLAGPVSRRDISATQASDGRYLWASLNRSTHDWAPEMREKIIAAMVLATRGEIDPGLARFERDWSGHVAMPALEDMAKFMAPSAFAKHGKAHAKAERELEEAEALVDALEQSAPSLNTVFERPAKAS